MLDLITSRPPRRSEGAPASVSVVVIGLNHRTVPLELLERMTVSDAAPAQGPARPARPGAPERGGGAVHLQAHRDLRGGRAVPRGHADVRNFLGEWSGSAPEDFGDHLYSFYDDGAVAHLFPVTSGSTRRSSARARSSARCATPGSGPRARARSARCSTGCSATPSRSASGPARRPASPGAPPRCPRPRWPWPPSGSVRSRAGRILVLGAGEMGEGMVQALVGVPGSATCWSPTAPGPGGGAGRALRWPSRSIWAACPPPWRRSTCC